ncbi:MAG: RNA polymerase factor sigma-54 [Candidatus Omnitrophica bacterium]|nr:RNA polymerase factor sigma-54 [Candidatus Omnitrophota bacterium]
MSTQLLPRQIQKPILAPVMQQSIEVLLLNLTELNLAIEQEMQNNPLLEINEEATLSRERSLEEITASVNELLRHAPSPGHAQHFTDDDILEERPVKTESSLEDILLRQLRVELNDPLDIRIGEYLIGNLDEDGYLKTTCAEVSFLLGVQDAGRVEKVLSLIQGFEPAGIASRDLRECLLTQIRSGVHPRKELLVRIIAEHLEDLGHKRFQQIARKMAMPVEEIKKLAGMIAALEPKPARNYRPVRSSIYIYPDVVIREDKENGYRVEVSREGVPQLRINAYYRNLLKRADLNDRDREFILEKFRNAVNFIKSVEQRGQTMRRIAGYLLERQKAFFEEGGPLVPMILKDVAQAIGRNESTVSRAIHNKFIDTPRGIFSIKFFFSQGIPATAGSDAASAAPHGFVASRSVKDEIHNLITSEDKRSPLSDQDIHLYLMRRDMQIARRTISKYRQALRILPSNLRKV